MMTYVLQIKNYSLNFDTFDGTYHALDNVSISVHEGETIGIVGETGCGKSVTIRNVLGLLPSPPARVVSGEMLFGGKDLLRVTPQEMRAIRGIDIAMIFQDPMTYLNPVFTIGDQLVDVIMSHQRFIPRGERISKRQAREKAREVLEKVKLPNPGNQMRAYPHELSGGMRQRVLIAMALTGKPKLLIADEPTTALDVTIQAQVLELINELVVEFKLSVILITHDLGVVAKCCDRVAVMYAGQIVEEGTVAEVLGDPKHPYTSGLLASIPHTKGAIGELKGIPGFLPNLLDPPVGCRFYARCPKAMDKCREVGPVLLYVDKTHKAACHLYQETQ